MKNIAIIIPIYKSELSSLEYISLMQLEKVLYKYTKIFVAPNSLEFKYDNVSSKWSVKRFKDNYFCSIMGYSNLLLNKDFYRAFSNYEYILIYQLDAFVFRDELDFFCNLNYDYIGAPVYKYEYHWNKINARVGNGGLSLRKVESCYKVVEQFNSICKNNDLHKIFCQYEDLFFGYCGANDNINFRVPDIKLALKFSICDYVGNVYRKLNLENLPFGCHGWSKKSRISIWKKIIESFGYVIDGDEYVSICSIENMDNIIYILKRFYRYDKNKIIKKMSRIIPRNREYSIYGLGTIGKITFELLKYAEYNIKHIYDANKEGVFEDIPVINFNGEIKENEMIFIATLDYENEIANRLLLNGFRENEDYIKYSNFFLLMIEELKWFRC